jgi:protein gp37
MGKVDVAWNAFLDTLNSDLKKIEERTFEAAALASVAHARDKMIEVMRSMESGRYEQGLAVRDYRNEYRQSGHEQVWRDDDGAGAKIARADRNSHARSTDNWIADAEFAEPLGDLLIEALLVRNYGPTEKRNRDIVTALIDLLNQNRPENLDDALILVDNVLAERTHGKRVPRDVSASELRDRLVTQIVKFIMKEPGRAWTVTLIEIFEQVKDVLQSERDERRAAVENQRRAVASRAHAGGLVRGVAVTAPGTAGPKSTSAAKPASLARKNSSRPQVRRKYSHPWGDACLDVLEVLTPSSGGNQRVRFHRKRLYEVGMHLKPTRYLVAEKFDLFDPRLADEVFDEHLNVFLKADWHTFVALTPHADSIRRHWQRWNIKPRHGFPTNFWPGVRVDCVDHLSRIRTLRETGMRTIWVSLVDYHSDPSQPLSASTFRSEIRGTGLVVFGWDFASPQSPLSREDAYVLAKAATEPGTGFFFTHPTSRQAFLTGNPSVPDLSVPTKPRVNDPDLDTLFDRAQSKQDLPQEWFEHPFYGRKGAFQEFTGEEIQLFDYLSDTGTDPISTAEAS